MYNKIFKSITPIFFLISEYCMNNKTPYFFRLNTINLFLSSILYHTSLEFNTKYTDYIFYYDRFSIGLLCSYRTFNNQLFALMFALLASFNNKFKDLTYILGFINVIFKLTNKKKIIILIIELISFYYFLKHHKRKNQEWTIIEKYIWHITQSIYIYISSFSFFE
tara:strand:- start:489 stop:983 length:495 start_codon:yes stop_codon:yes gene_type:complete